MKLRTNTLWKVPVFCIVCGFVCLFLTTSIGGFFFGEKTVMEDGTIKLSINYTRAAIWSGFLFAAVLLLGGLWAFRSMTRAEIALSAAIITIVFLIDCAIPTTGASWFLLGYAGWIDNLYTVLYQLTHHSQLSQWLPCLAPLLFIPFGKKAAKEQAQV